MQRLKHLDTEKIRETLKECDWEFCEEEVENTPDRIKRFMEEWDDSDFNFTMFENPDYNEMVILKDIEFSSICAHHLLPFHGKGHIGYVPDKKICGISKLARALDKFAHKPQTQEKLTQELADFLEEKLEPQGLMIVLEAQHDCMRIRGIKKKNSQMVTSVIRGVFKEQDKTRKEFLELIK